MNSLYLLLVAIVVLFSWVGSVYALPLPNGEVLPNLLSEEGIRWIVRHSIENIAAAPFAEVILILISIGALRSSGLLEVIIHRDTARRERYALRSALAVFFACVGLLLLGLIPGGNLLGVTGHIEGGPFAAGWLFLLTLVLSLPSIVYGWMSGNYHGKKDVFSGLSCEVVSYASYFVTLVVASQLVAVMRYVCVFDLLGTPHTVQEIVVDLIYAIPLIVLFITKKFGHDTSSVE